MNEKQLKKILLTYEVNEPSKASFEKTKEAVLGLKQSTSVPKFDFVHFLFGQLHYLNKSFFVTCALYFAIVLSVGIFSSSNSSLVLLCSATPFLSVGALGSLLNSSNGAIFELEATCFYQPKTVFAARSVLCAVFNFFAVLICSLTLSLFTKEKLALAVLLGLASLVLSSSVTLVFTAVFKAKTALLLSVGFFCSVSGLILGSNELAKFIVSLSNQILLAVLVLSLGLLAFVYLMTVKKYDYERMVKRNGT